ICRKKDWEEDCRYFVKGDGLPRHYVRPNFLTSTASLENGSALVVLAKTEPTLLVIARRSADVAI
ncbi:MAG: hypothetical protein WCG60_00765, partial [bacterium]